VIKLAVGIIERIGRRSGQNALASAIKSGCVNTLFMMNSYDLHDSQRFRAGQMQPAVHSQDYPHSENPHNRHTTHPSLCSRALLPQLEQAPRVMATALPPFVGRLPMGISTLGVVAGFLVDR